MPPDARRLRSRAAPIALVLLLVASGRAAAQQQPEESDEGLLSSAPVGATHRSGVRYRLPFPPRVPRLLAQGVHGATTHHSEPNVFAFDFVMPIGTPVLAAREGTVLRVRDGALGPGKPGEPGNLVSILHDDGTVGSYVHLRKGIPVERGQKVERGELIGYSGLTGQTKAPHLHFAVLRLTAARRVVSVPIRFGRTGFVPKEGQWYGSPGRPNAKLRLAVDGQTVTGGFYPVRPNAEASIRVFLQQAGRPERDVTEDPKTEIVSMTPWSVVVIEGARVAFRPDEGFDLSSFDAIPKEAHELATVAIFHGEPGDPVIGLGRIEFRASGP